MKAAKAVLLCYATLVTESAAADARPEILHRHRQRSFLQSNASLDNIQHKTTAATATIIRSPELFTKHSLSSLPETASISTMDVAASGSPSSPAAPPISSSPTTAFTPDAEVDNFRRSTSSPSTEGVYSTRDPSQVSAQTFDSAVNWSAGPSSIAGCTYIDASECSSAFSATNGSNIAYATKSSLLMSLSPTEPCTPFPSDKAVTEYSIVYTSTITFYGNTSDYTPPYSPITTPNYCSPPGEALITFFSTSRITNSTATLTVPATSSASPSYGLMIPGPAPTFSIDLPEIITQTADAAGKHGGGVATTMRPFLSFTRHVITFITTDKNPSVVFSPEFTPSFSQTLITGGLVDGNHETIQPTDGPQTNTRISDPLESVKQSPVPTFRLTAGGDQVIINDKTVSGLKPGQTTTITVGTEAFTILPTAVVGLGSTITKPAPQEAATPPMPTATSRVLGGASVVISGSQVVVDGTTLGVSPQQATTTVNGKEVVLGTGAVVVDGETLIFRDHPPRPTDEIVAGGEMLTAIGNSVVVVRSATITYGPRIAPYETTVNGEVISIGPRGVSLHGTTIGGPLANATDTEYEIVGGVTVGKLLPSLVVVNGVTYSVNQDGDPNNAETTVIDNQTITIGPSGLIMSSQTLTYPGASVTATLSPPGTPMPDIPAETGTRDGRGGDGDSGASSAHLGAHVGGVMCICLAISVWVMS